MADRKTYITTDKAGSRVAGRVVPRDELGKGKAGVELELTDAEAEYELSQGTIVLKPEAKGKAFGKPAGDAPTGDGSKPA